MPKNEHKKVTDELLSEMRELYIQGWSYRRIANRLMISTHTIENYLSGDIELKERRVDTSGKESIHEKWWKCINTLNKQLGKEYVRYTGELSRAWEDKQCLLLGFDTMKHRGR